MLALSHYVESRSEIGSRIINKIDYEQDEDGFFGFFALDNSIRGWYNGEISNYHNQNVNNKLQ